MQVATAHERQLARVNKLQVTHMSYLDDRRAQLGQMDEREQHRREVEAKLAGWTTTHTKDDARDKAVASHETMGLVSALLAGFELQALVEVDTCQVAEECSNAEGLFVGTAAFCVGLSTIVVLETSFEYMFVMRELHHGSRSAWNLLEQFRFCRRAAEASFALEIIIFLMSTGLMVHVRFAKTLPIGAGMALMLLTCCFLAILGMVWAMQKAKMQHGEGAKQKREEALQEQLRLRELRSVKSDKQQKRGSMAPNVSKRLSTMFTSGGTANANRSVDDGGAVHEGEGGEQEVKSCAPFRRAKTEPKFVGFGRSVPEEEDEAVPGSLGRADWRPSVDSQLDSGRSDESDSPRPLRQPPPSGAGRSIMKGSGAARNDVDRGGDKRQDVTAAAVKMDLARPQQVDRANLLGRGARKSDVAAFESA